MTPARTLAASFAASAALIATAALAQPVLGGAKFKTSLSGAAEIPGPGDPDGSGEATITINPGKSQVCWKLNVRNIAPATAAHIHIGLAGMSGGVVVALSAPSGGTSEGCATVDRSLADAIRKSPSSYYVNVHNADFGNGALRGQLG